MATTFPLATLAAAISSSGISAPSYNDILTSLKESFKQIYGVDVYIEADSQDGQLLAIFARAIHDCNQAAISVYQAFSPATAQGEGLSSVVKINHMQRAAASKSQVNLTLTGTAGTTILSGVASDPVGNKWLLPSVVTIPPAGSIEVTATAEKDGAISAALNTITTILTPVAGWQTVTNASTATLGQPIESDAQLRLRQEITPALNSYTTLTGLVAALKALPGVVYGVVYENDTSTPSGEGIPGHSIAAVVRGGDSQDIAETIYAKKAPGVGTYGSSTVTIVDASGADRDIEFTIPTEVPLKVGITLNAYSGYNTNISDMVKASVAAYINGTDIGEDLVVNRLYSPALLEGDPLSETYKITVLQAAKVPDALGTADIVITFVEKATCLISDVTITVV